jgi:hypothetical protein
MHRTCPETRPVLNLGHGPWYYSVHFPAGCSMHRISCLVLLVALAMSFPAVVAAQERQPFRARLAPRPPVEIGLWAGYDVDAEAPAGGGQLRLPVGAFLEVVASGGYTFVSEFSAWQANLDAALRLGFRQAIYGGAGAAVAHRAFENGGEPVSPEDTRWGVNLFFGVSLPRFLPIRFRPYAEARWTFVSDYDAALVMQAGLNLRF